MAFAARAVTPDQAEENYGFFDFLDEASTASREEFLGIFDQLAPQSTFWQRKLKFIEARRSLRSMAFPEEGWHPYGTEPPNLLARGVTARVLNMLEQLALPPSQLTASAEGGIGLAFVDRTRRAMIEIYNDGDIVVGTYSLQGTPDTWETSSAEIRDTIERLRVYLTA
jgi:hypothetical protein